MNGGIDSIGNTKIFAQVKKIVIKQTVTRQLLVMVVERLLLVLRKGHQFLISIKIPRQIIA